MTYFKFQGGTVLALVRFCSIVSIPMFVLAGMSFLESVRYVIPIFIIMYSYTLLLCGIVTALIRQKVAVLSEDEIIILPDCHIAYEEIIRIEYYAAEPFDITVLHGLTSNPSLLKIYIKGNKRELCQTVEGATVRLFYDLRKKGNMKAKRGKLMVITTFISMGICLIVSIGRALY